MIFSADPKDPTQRNWESPTKKDRKMTITKPVITLKNIKHFEAGSQETHCYTATIYVDGKRFATVENNGHGGCDNVHPINGGWDAIKELEERIKETYPRIELEYFEDGLEPSLEIICGDLVNDFLLKKEFKKVMRRISYIKPNERGIYQLPAKYKPTPEMIAQVKEKAPWAKGVTFLADLSESEAMEAFKKNG